MIDQYPPANGVLTSLIWRKTAAGGETSLSGYDNASQALSYTPGQEQVYLNGILLVRGSDYTATNGTSITGLTALAVDDFVQINCYNNFSVASVPAASITGEVTNSQITSLATSKLTGTITNAQLAGSIANDKLTNSSITINGSAVSLGGSVSLPGDIESVTAGTGISGGGSSGEVTITNSMATAIDAKGDLVVGTGADTFSKLGVGANGTVLTAASGQATGLQWAAAGGITSGSNFVLTEETTTSTSYTDLATSQAVTLTTGTKALVIITAGMYNTSANLYVNMSFAVSGASSVAASDDNCLRLGYMGAGVSHRASSVAVLTGLTAGSNTFTAKFKTQAGTSGFNQRYLFVMDLGS